MLHKFYSILKLDNRSPKWDEVRKQHLKHQPFCQACGSKVKLHVHHIEPFHINPSRELDPTNLITLCSKYCHYSIGHLMDYKSWNINVVEDSKVYLDKVSNRPYLLKTESYNEIKKPYLYRLFFGIFNFWR